MKVIVVGLDVGADPSTLLEWVCCNVYKEGDEVHIVTCFEEIKSYEGHNYSFLPSAEDQEKWKEQKREEFHDCLKVPIIIQL